jgi:hypothetical protein
MAKRMAEKGRKSRIKNAITKQGSENNKEVAPNPY